MTFLRKLADILYSIITYIVVVFGLVPLFGFIMKVLNRTEVRNVHHVQKAEPPFLFISNHVTMLDDAFLGPLIFWPRALWDWRFIPFHTPEKKNFFRGPFFSFMMWAARSIPFTRGQGVFQPGMERVIRLLKTGHVVHIYPEGTRTRSGDIGKGKIGVGRMIRETGVKVIPCYHSGLGNVLPIGTKIPKTGKSVKVLIGEPIYFDEFMDLPNAPKTWQMISDRLIEEIKTMRDRMSTEWSELGAKTDEAQKTTPVP
ncbi:MAG: lysophospholipid acyltransferase family protein [bacterium]|nr:1-acyl-sn-glycerol-3-phosphate acyltransferase [bacterium]